MLQEFHLSDRELLLLLDGELSAREAARSESHLSACWACRTRKHELEGAIGEFVRIHRSCVDDGVGAPEGLRALLKAQLHELAKNEQPSVWTNWLRGNAARRAVVSCALLLIAAGALVLFFQLRTPFSYRVVTVPNPNLTPGATVLRTRQEVCRDASVKNKAVPAALAKVVFAEYGIRSVERGAYEVDYLITPALGGADDIRNLWPQSSRATVWNSQAKDKLEDQLRALVCDGQLDLTIAQREIAGNWIEAYKKHFPTDPPKANTP